MGKKTSQKRRATAVKRRRTRRSLMAVTLLVLGVGAGYALWQSTDEGKGTAGRSLFARHRMGPAVGIPFLPPDQPQPHIELPKPFHDFGTVGSNDVMKHTFVIRNSGKGPLTISRAYTTCGCTTAVISASVIPPSGEATAIVTFDAGYHDTRGHTPRRGVIMENNDLKQPRAELWVQAHVRSN